MAIDRAWWKEATVYQIYPRSFNDSDGNGVGDLPGIIRKVEYLDDLDVDVVWLCPVYESPQADMGYDVSDYRAIDDQFGDMADLERLLDRLHERDIRLVVDQIVNHTSDEHPWFEAARSSRDDPKRDWYHWHPGSEDGGPPNNWESFMGGSAWEYDEPTGEYYLHTYHRKQPDLNWANPDVRGAIYEMLRWWLEKGIDGFRLDVINHLSKPAGYPDSLIEDGRPGPDQFVNGPRIHEYVRELHEEVLADYDIVAIGETPDITVEQARAYIEDGLDMVFHFEHMDLDYGPGGRWDLGEWDLADLREVTTEWQTAMHPDGWNGLYLGNHDQARIVSRFGDEDYHRESATLIATFLLTLRGTPHLYQGDEIGMTNADFATFEATRDPETRNRVRELMAETGRSYEAFRDLVNARSRDNSRTPMQWSDAAHAGFTTGEPWIEVTDNYTDINVERARADPDSIWHYYRDLLALRDERDVLVYGAYECLTPDHERLFAYTRTLDDERVLVVLNWADEPTTAALPVATGDATLLVANHECDDDDPSTVALAPYEARVYDLR